MTDNQFTQLFDLVTKCVNGIQKVDSDVIELKSDVSELKSGVAELKSDVTELKSDVAELKSDVGELKEGQKRIEAEVRQNTTAINKVVSEQFRIKLRVEELENASV